VDEVTPLPSFQPPRMKPIVSMMDPSTISPEYSLQPHTLSPLPFSKKRDNKGNTEFKLQKRGTIYSNYKESPRSSKAGDDEFFGKGPRRKLVPSNSLKPKQFQIDVKSKTVIAHFNSIQSEKRVNKQKLKELMTKVRSLLSLQRYNEPLAERLVKYLGPYFRNFTVNFDYPHYCKAIEKFANQSD